MCSTLLLLKSHNFQTASASARASIATSKAAVCGLPACSRGHSLLGTGQSEILERPQVVLKFDNDLSPCIIIELMGWLGCGLQFPGKFHSQKHVYLFDQIIWRWVSICITEKWKVSDGTSTCSRASLQEWRCDTPPFARNIAYLIMYNYSFRRYRGY